MCGISGYIGKKRAVSIVLEGIGKLEYRGYDSAGIGTLVNGKLCVEKRVGKVGNLRDVFKGERSQLAIAHTRWATHGIPSELNAHPHCDFSHKCAVVHNGIIENHDILRKELQRKGIVCSTDTDSEVIPHLISSYYKGNLLEAVTEAVSRLRGAFAIVVMHEDHPGELICTAKESPLAIGMGNKEAFIGSDANIFLQYTRKVIYLHSSEIAQVTATDIKTFDVARAPIVKEPMTIAQQAQSSSKGDFAHYTLKEIYEQPQTIQNALQEIIFPQKNINRILILGCGTSYHAGLVAGYTFESLARTAVEIHISSEYRYRNPLVSEGTLCLAISQSGETADTLAVIADLKEKGANILGICNVQNSTLARLADSSLFLHAGPEVGVCSTKAFTSQLIVLTLLALALARQKGMDPQTEERYMKELRALPQKAQQVLEKRQQIREIAQKYAHYNNFFYLGRRYMYPTALEGALKLKEIAYINANGYAAGEMKHGPIALIDPNCPTVACMADLATVDKMQSNLREVKARSGKIIALCPEGIDPSVADEVITLPATLDELSAILTTIATQLLAYEIALERGCEIDQPRNLAKSVTVE